jgi:hypothetical protein
MLPFDEAMQVLFSPSEGEGDDTMLMLKMAQACLVNGTGKTVYKPDEIERMKTEVRPATALMAVGLAAYKLNDVDRLRAISHEVAGSEKN